MLVPSGVGCDVGAYEGPGLAMLQITREAFATNSIRWLAEAGRVYRLDESTNLVDWTCILTNPPAAGWRTNHLNGGATRFLRLRTE